MNHRAALALGAMLASLLLLGSARTSFAEPPPPTLPSIVNTQAGVDDGLGDYLWEWNVDFGSRPALSHWLIIDLCDDVFGDIVPGSFFGSPKIEYGLDPTTNEFGLKFDDIVADDGGSGLFGFKTNNEWPSGLSQVVFKSGQNIHYQDDVLTPVCECTDCNPPPPPTPEPGTMALLGTGLIGLIWKRRTI